MKNTIFKIAVIFGVALLMSCYGDIYSTAENISVEMETKNIMFDFVSVNDLDDLLFWTTDVIRAKVLDERVDKINTLIPSESTSPDALQYFYEVFTIYRLKVLEVFKGDTFIDEIIELAISGGQYGNINIITDPHTKLAIGEDLVVFMRVPAIEGNPFFRSTMTQSLYKFAEPISSDITRGMNVELENIHHHSIFTITVQDLMNIAETNFPTDNPEDDEATPKTTREKLSLAIQEAEERMQTMYTSISWARLLSALRDARNVYNNLNATQLEIDDVTDNLRLAIETLEELPPEPEPVDRTELIAAIEVAEARVQAMYTPISWARLQNLLRDARNIRDNANATQEQIDSAMEILITALNGLVSR